MTHKLIIVRESRERTNLYYPEYSNGYRTIVYRVNDVIGEYVHDGLVQLDGQHPRVGEQHYLGGLFHGQAPWWWTTTTRTRLSVCRVALHSVARLAGLRGVKRGYIGHTGICMVIITMVICFYVEYICIGGNNSISGIICNTNTYGYLHKNTLIYIYIYIYSYRIKDTLLYKMP